MSKVTLPKEVASAIEELRSKGFSNYKIAYIGDYDEIIPAYHARCLRVIAAWLGEDFERSDELMSALVNGYEVEKSPEDKLREYIENNRTWIDRPEDYAISERQRYVGRNQGVMMTLSILGITIEGIND